MTSWKKFSAMALVGLASATLLAACGGSSEASAPIDVVTREDGSGTRGAFVELFGVKEDDTDQTVSSAVVTNSTSVMMTTVSGDDAAIGYVSLGALDDDVKAVAIDGATPSVDHVKDGSYKISRPFNIVTKETLSEAAQDFINFIMSKDGQAIVEDNGYIPTDQANDYKASVDSGKVTISGSSSVSPIMEKLKEAYKNVNPNVDVVLQTSDSTTGITDVSDGTSDIGMASRELTDDETSKGVQATVIATDGIAVIVNKENAVKELTSKEVKAIYTGDIASWSDLEGKKK